MPRAPQREGSRGASPVEATGGRCRPCATCATQMVPRRLKRQGASSPPRLASRGGPTSRSKAAASACNLTRPLALRSSMLICCRTTANSTRLAWPATHRRQARGEGTGQISQLRSVYAMVGAHGWPCEPAPTRPLPFPSRALADSRSTSHQGRIKAASRPYQGARRTAGLRPSAAPSLPRRPLLSSDPKPLLRPCPLVASLRLAAAAAYCQA